MTVLVFAITVYTWLVLARWVLDYVRLPPTLMWKEGLAPITDPYINSFRRRMPPVGHWDLSPVAALITLQVLSETLLLADRHLIGRGGFP